MSAVLVYDCANLSQTYSALMCLLILGDDLSRVDRKAIFNAIRLAQREDGWLVGFDLHRCPFFTSLQALEDLWVGLGTCFNVHLIIDFSFWSQGEGSESDMRFVYCAVSVCHVLGDDSVIDWSRLRNFIRESTRYDGGIGQGPFEESHGQSYFSYSRAFLCLSH